MAPALQVSQAVSRWIKFCPDYRDHKFLCYNLPTVSRLQEGPQCGLVALAMAGEDTSLELVVAEALDRGYTKQGEMFSVENMAELARVVLDREVKVVESHLLLDTHFLISRLTQGRPLLVPYDCAHNHSPALLKGRKAHWALVTGLVLASRDLRLNEVKDNLVTEPGSSTENVFLLERNIEKNIPDLSSVFSQPGSVHLIARQSKSRVLGIWEPGDLVRSNNNLLEVDLKRDQLEYVIPEGGIEAGLCGRMVLL